MTRPENARPSPLIQPASASRPPLANPVATARGPRGSRPVIDHPAHPAPRQFLDEVEQQRRRADRVGNRPPPQDASTSVSPGVLQQHPVPGLMNDFMDHVQAERDLAAVHQHPSRQQRRQEPVPMASVTTSGRNSTSWPSQIDHAWHRMDVEPVESPPSPCQHQRQIADHALPARRTASGAPRRRPVHRR